MRSMKYSRECSSCSHDTCSVITGMLRRSLYSMPDAARSTFTLFCFSFDFSAMLCLTLSTRLLLNITVINQSLRAIRKRDVQLLWFRNYLFPGHLRWRGNDKLFANKRTTPLNNKLTIFINKSLGVRCASTLGDAAFEHFVSPHFMDGVIITH